MQMEEIHSSDMSCSRHLSRVARSFLYEEMPMLQVFKAKYSLTKSKFEFDTIFQKSAILPSCGLHPMRDLYLYQEQQKQKLPSGFFQCALCNKVFSNEFYIDRHLGLKHNDTLPTTDRSPVCLADLIPILGISDLEYKEQLSPNFKETKGCNRKMLSKAKYRCQIFLRECQLENDVTLGSICDELHCNIFGDIQSREKKSLKVLSSNHQVLFICASCILLIISYCLFVRLKFRSYPKFLSSRVQEKNQFNVMKSASGHQFRRR